MPFDINRRDEPLVSMNRFWPNVQPDQPKLKFAGRFQQMIDYMKYMDAAHPEASSQFVESTMIGIGRHHVEYSIAVRQQSICQHAGRAIVLAASATDEQDA